MALQEHDYKVEYLEGEVHENADCLSGVIAATVQAHDDNLTQQGLAHLPPTEVDLDDHPRHNLMVTSCTVQSAMILQKQPTWPSAMAAMEPLICAKSYLPC